MFQDQFVDFAETSDDDPAPVCTFDYSDEMDRLDQYRDLLCEESDGYLSQAEASRNQSPPNRRSDFSGSFSMKAYPQNQNLILQERPEMDVLKQSAADYSLYLNRAENDVSPVDSKDSTEQDSGIVRNSDSDSHDRTFNTPDLQAGQTTSDDTLAGELAKLNKEMQQIQLECDRLVKQYSRQEERVKAKVAHANEIVNIIDKVTQRQQIADGSSSFDSLPNGAKKDSLNPPLGQLSFAEKVAKYVEMSFSPSVSRASTKNQHDRLQNLKTIQNERAPYHDDSIFSADCNANITFEHEKDLKKMTKIDNSHFTNEKRNSGSRKNSMEGRVDHFHSSFSTKDNTGAQNKRGNNNAPKMRMGDELTAAVNGLQGRFFPNKPSQVKDDRTRKADTPIYDCPEYPFPNFSGLNPPFSALQYQNSPNLHPRGTVCTDPETLGNVMTAQQNGLLRSLPYRKPCDNLLSRSYEWKVKRRSDGSRYITRGPIRSQKLRERAQQVCAERQGLTTDDDAASELKFGRYWSRGQRKHHLSRAKERRQNQRQSLLTTSNIIKENEILKLSNEKMVRHKTHQIFDKFTTIQEFLAHGSKSLEDSKRLGILSVTTV